MSNARLSAANNEDGFGGGSVQRLQLHGREIKLHYKSIEQLRKYRATYNGDEIEATL